MTRSSVRWLLVAWLLIPVAAYSAVVRPRPRPAAAAAQGTAPTTAPAGAEEFPSVQHPWKGDFLSSRRQAYQQAIEALMSLPAEQVRAHAAAADFPGLVPAKAEPVVRRLRVDTAVSGWQSTGLYAAPGQLITVTVPPAAVLPKHPLQVRIGCHTDRLWNNTISVWQRVPEISRALPVAAPVTRAANAFGGLIYLVVPQNCPPATWEVTIAGGIPAPYYVLGRTSLADWRKVLRSAPAPWAELEGHGLVFSLPAETVRQLDDPETVMKFWDQIVAAEDELAGKTDRRAPERMVFDRQISAGYMHSGYPVMGPVSAAKAVVGSLAELRKGNWGVYHELGHNHQSGKWTFDGTVEVTCNLFTMYCNEKVCGIARSTGHDLGAPKQQAKVQQYLAGGTFDEWKKEPFLALCMYDQLIEAFGWEPLKSVFAEYRDAPKGELPKTDEQKRDQWLVRYSRKVGRNLGPFFEAWKIPTSAAARQAVQDLPGWMPGQSSAPQPATPGKSKPARRR